MKKINGTQHTQQQHEKRCVSPYYIPKINTT
jgi:hypothetical protein